MHAEINSHMFLYFQNLTISNVFWKKRENRSHREELNHGRKLPKLLPFRPFANLSTLFLIVPTFIRCIAIIFKHIPLSDLIYYSHFIPDNHTSAFVSF